MTASYALKNKVDGQFLVLDTTADIELGKWDKVGHEDLHRNTPVPPSTMRQRRSRDRQEVGGPQHRGSREHVGPPRPQRRSTLTVESIAMLVPPINVDQDILATANPFLAGMPKGTVASLYNPHNSPDYAGDRDQPASEPAADSDAPCGRQHAEL